MFIYTLLSCAYIKYIKTWALARCTCYKQIFRTGLSSLSLCVKIILSSFPSMSMVSGIQGQLLEVTGPYVSFFSPCPPPAVKGLQEISYASNFTFCVWFLIFCSCGMQQIEGHRVDFTAGSVRVSRVWQHQVPNEDLHWYLLEFHEQAPPFSILYISRSKVRNSGEKFLCWLTWLDLCVFFVYDTLQMISSKVNAVIVPFSCSSHGGSPKWKCTGWPDGSCFSVCVSFVCCFIA